MNQFNALYNDEPNEPPRECNIQPTASHFKSRTSPSNTSPVVSAIMGRTNHRAIDNGDVQVHASDFPVGFNYESVTDTDTTLIKSINDNVMDHLIDSSIQNTMKILWVFASIFFKIDWWLSLLKKFIQSLLCCFINMEEQMLQSKIACHNFLCLSQRKPL